MTWKAVPAPRSPKMFLPMRECLVAPAPLLGVRGHEKSSSSNNVSSSEDCGEPPLALLLIANPIPPRHPPPRTVCAESRMRSNEARQTGASSSELGGYTCGLSISDSCTRRRGGEGTYIYIPCHGVSESRLVLFRTCHSRSVAAASCKAAIFDPAFELLVPRIRPDAVDDADDEFLSGLVYRHHERIVHDVDLGEE